MIPLPFLSGKRVVVMGLGKSGMASLDAVARSGGIVAAWDDNPQSRAKEPRAATNPLATDLAGVDLVIWSPGIAHTHPQPHPLAEAARAKAIPVVCDVDILGRAKPDCTVLAVTGTNGKSTTTTLLLHILTAAGRTAAAGGNLGMPALSLPDFGPEGRYVLELSSYQLELIPDLVLNAGVLINITPDHLGRHGGMDGYIAAKKSLFDRVRDGGTAVIGVDDPHSVAIADQLDANRLRIVRISSERALTEGISAPDGVLLDNGTPITDLKAIARLPGRHNWQNALCAYALARADGIDPQVIAAALATYPGLAHRQELVAEIDGVRFINDSKATNADASAKALDCYDRILWIIGGQPKEGGIVSLEPYFPKIAHAYLIGDAAQAFARTLDGKAPYTHCGTLDVAVAQAAQAASALGAGAVVLLSPACASWDQFKSFEHRGDVFRALVQTLSHRALPKGGQP